MITIPDSLWFSMIEAFMARRRDVEQVCYFDGLCILGGGVATTLTFPNAMLAPRRFNVEPYSMSQAGKHLRSFRLVRLAQVHTHPEEWTGHSSWDDQHAYSQIPGSISIVLPHYARLRPSLADAGVHLRTDCGWSQLRDIEVNAHIRLIPSVLDFRIPEETGVEW